MKTNEIIETIVLILMGVGLLLGIVFLFIFIISPSIFAFKMTVCGWVGYFIFGHFSNKLSK